MIEGVICPLCEQEIPVQIVLDGDLVKNGFIEVDCIGRSEDKPFSQVTITLTLNYQKILDNLESIKELVEKQKVYEASKKV